MPAFVVAHGSNGAGKTFDATISLFLQEWSRLSGGSDNLSSVYALLIV